MSNKDEKIRWIISYEEDNRDPCGLVPVIILKTKGSMTKILIGSKKEWIPSKNLIEPSEGIYWINKIDDNIYFSGTNY